MEDFTSVWSRVEAHAGEEFRTVRGLPFRYRVTSAHVVPDRTRYPLHRSQLETAYQHRPLSGPGQLNDLVRGPSYVYAILTDPRIHA